MLKQFNSHWNTPENYPIRTGRTPSTPASVASLWAGQRRQGVELSTGAAAERRAQRRQADPGALVPNQDGWVSIRPE